MMKPASLCILLLTATVTGSPASVEDINGRFTLPNVATNYRARAAAIQAKRKGWLYKDYPLGGAYYPTGILANKTIADQQAQWFPVVVEHAKLINEESSAALAGIIAAGNFSTLDDYAKTYENQWNMSLPNGPMTGMVTNYTDDRLFSMMRLSATPYKLYRVQRHEKLLFPVDDAASITDGFSLRALQAQGRLFAEDYSDLKVDLAPTDKYGAGCQAYFYIDNSGDFLPLAIKPIVKGREKSALVYTPKDKPADWLLAKMLINQNGGFHSTWDHVGKSHSVAEISYLAAIRTLSDNHPVMGILSRFEKQPFGVRPNLQTGLTSGASFIGPQYYPWTADAAVDYLNELYLSGKSADFERNYYCSEFRARGLVDSSGPKLKSFPFYEDASRITEAIREVMEAFINSYYSSNESVRKDVELQAWYREAKAARIYDFPRIDSRQSIADILTHHAYFNTIVSNVMSTNGIHMNSMALPFSPAGFLQPIPSKKGLTEDDLMKFMPTPEGAVWQVSTYVVGHRPMWRDTNETISHLFDDETLLAKTNSKTRIAAARFKAIMDDFSVEVRARTFDEDGLNRGMPYIWDALDPNYAPYWAVI